MIVEEEWEGDENDGYSMDTRSSIAIVPLASLDVDIRAARWVTRPSVGWFAEVTFLGRAFWGLSSLRPSVAVEQGASLESVMVERENVVMEGENRSHGGSDDDQTLGSHSQRHPRVRTLQQQKHVDLIFTSILGTRHAASCLRI